MGATIDPGAAADPQQAQLLERLRAARGAPLSFAELRAHGIENPAVLCYELELAGTPIDHVRFQQGPQRPLAAGVRVEHSARRPAPAIASQPWRRPASPPAPRAQGPRSRARRVTVALTLAAIALALGATALALLDRAAVRRVRVAGAPAGRLTGGPPPSRAPAAAKPRRAASAGRTVASEPKPAAPPPATAGRGPDSAQAARLQAEGHELLARADYAAAIADLRAALAASGQSVAGCALPAGEACLTYAYALYDLGHALRLAGDPHDAMAVLGERLRIDNQRTTVLAELRLAAVAASTNVAPAPTPPTAPVGEGDRGHGHGAGARGRAERP